MGSYITNIKNWPIKYKVMAVAFIGITAFVLYLGLNFKANVQNESRITEIRDIDFPVLEIINDTAIALTNIKKSLADAVSAGEEESLEAATAVAEEIFSDIQHIGRVAPELATEAKSL